MSGLINYRITMKSIAARYFLAENAAVSALHLRGEFAAHRLFEPFELAPQSIGRNDGQLATASPLLATYIFLTSIGRVGFNRPTHKRWTRKSKEHDYVSLSWAKPLTARSNGSTLPAPRYSSIEPADG